MITATLSEQELRAVRINSVNNTDVTDRFLFDAIAFEMWGLQRNLNTGELSESETVTNSTRLEMLKRLLLERVQTFIND